MSVMSDIDLVVREAIATPDPAAHVRRHLGDDERVLRYALGYLAEVLSRIEPA